jgi:hypothetical protein
VVLYVLVALVAAGVGAAVVRRPRRRLLIASCVVVVLGYLLVGSAFLAEGGAALGRFYLGTLTALLGMVGVVVLGVAECRWRRGRR